MLKVVPGANRGGDFSESRMHHSQNVLGPCSTIISKKKKKFAATFLKRTDGQDSGHDASLALVVHV